MSERDYFVRVSEQLGALNASVRAVLERLEKGDRKLADHEVRINRLEAAAGGKGLNRDWLVRQLVDIVKWTVIIIGAMAGAGGMLDRLLPKA